MALPIHENILNIEYGKVTEPPTYTVTANNGNHKPRISFEYEGVGERELRTLLHTLEMGFRNVEAMDETTGEIVYTHYEGGDFFQANYTPSETIDRAMLCINTLRKA
jgi:hypothetical protein